jgi:hypothetical protein
MSGTLRILHGITRIKEAALTVLNPQLQFQSQVTQSFRLTPFPDIILLSLRLTMKIFTVALFAALAAASPIIIPESAAIELQARQLGLSSSELESGSSSACPKAILIFARGSTETGNLVSLDSCLLSRSPSD